MTSLLDQPPAIRFGAVAVVLLLVLSAFGIPPDATGVTWSSSLAAVVGAIAAAIPGRRGAKRPRQRWAFVSNALRSLSGTQVRRRANHR
jgi:hypothetical protein